MSECQLHYFVFTWSLLVFLSFDLLVTEISSLTAPQHEASPTNNRQDFQLVGGDSRCNGIVEGKDKGEWRPLEDRWRLWKTEHSAQLCTHLGCGSVISMKRHYLPRRKPMWALDHHCEDSGRSICTSWRSSTSERLMTVACSDTVRLLEGRDRCSGNLMVRSSQSWSPMCNSVFNPENAFVVCRELGCGVPRDYHRMTSSPGQDMQVWSPDFKCKGNEEKLQECPSFSFNSTEENCGKMYITCIEHPVKPQATVYTAHSDGMYVLRGHRFAITCSHNTLYTIQSFRLTKRLHVGDPTVWTEPAVDNSATFLFPAAEDSHKGFYDCDYNYQLSSATFSETKTISITVQEPHDLRLMEGGSQCAGRLEVKHVKEWRPVSYQNNWSLKEAAVVCRQLECGLAVSTTKQDKTSQPEPVWHFYSDCDGSELALMDCGTVKNQQSSRTVEVVCMDVLPRPKITLFSGYTGEKHRDVKLIRGYSFTIKCSVEPWYPDGHFSLNFNSLNQTLSRRQPAVNHSARFVFPIAHAPHAGNYTCVYHNFVFGQNFSSASHGLSLSISDDLDVMLDDGQPRRNGSISCAGKLHVHHKNQMRALGAESSSWDLKQASVVCRQLGCGAALSTEACHLPNKEAVWRFFSDCDGSESALMDCGNVAHWFSSSAVVVVCEVSSREQGGEEDWE
ncbi:scavenger receptor cysteine-rich type 1 protein M130-like isoform X2 [Entelurus aequoreus]|uniref:scavenger receptor cysteine-rich type 1 protein M130-like isoform X2 n=1 Tax=Entelurus aequoreus TaxID=161455 RepID=UPI002B1DA177|nr:scavenger receptor cysteine-rich type 1 protein M130-like isoform X2 [Entelurus aequoreus]